MSEPPEVPDPATNPRRDSWSLRTIVKEVSGHSLEEFQDPARAPHPYLRVKPPEGGPPTAGVHPTAHHAVRAEVAAGKDDPPTVPTDPVDRFNPPLVGAVGRRSHGPGQVHDADSLESVGGPGVGRPSSPSRRPERVYLHYLLLHLDRLSDHALRYLERAVSEELEHRKASGPERPQTPP